MLIIDMVMEDYINYIIYKYINIKYMDIKNYINSFPSLEKNIIYDFQITKGGIGDYLKFFMSCLIYCISNNFRFYKKNNFLIIDKYIKVKYDIFNITNNEISKLKNYTIKYPQNYYSSKIYYNIKLNEIFIFDDSVKENIKNIISFLPDNYISIHLRLGDTSLEKNREYIISNNDKRKYSKEKIYKFIEENIHENIIFFCDNNDYKLNIKKKYENIIITNSQISHTSFPSTTDKEVLDTITEFYILSNSQKIYAASKSGFSLMASKFKNIEYISE